MDTAEEKVCPACNNTMVNGVCTHCSTKAEDSAADIQDENLHGGVIAEATPAMSEQTMGEDIASAEPKESAE